MRLWLCFLVPSVMTLTKITHAQVNCQSSQNDEELIELFNMNIALGNYRVLFTSTATNYEATLICPQDSGFENVLREFDFSLSYGADQLRQQVSCRGEKIIISKDDLAGGRASGCRGARCLFQAIARNTDTSVFYSTTTVSLDVTSESATPLSLLPARLPVCNSSIPICHSQTGCGVGALNNNVLKVCMRAGGCTKPGNSAVQDYNDNIYFQTSIITTRQSAL